MHSPVQTDNSGHRGQFDILVDGRVVVSRKGGLFAKLFGKPWPETADVAEAVRKAVRAAD